MKLNKKFRQGVVAVLGLMIAATASADDLRNRRKIVEPGEELFGLSYNELVDRWTNWFITEPIATHPAFDPDGRFCDRNQEGRVWFLAPSDPPRRSGRRVGLHFHHFIRQRLKTSIAK